jgi:hypothetical protein
VVSRWNDDQWEAIKQCSDVRYHYKKTLSNMRSNGKDTEKESRFFTR